jgi:lysophospholipase L1-like esterase
VPSAAAATAAPLEVVALGDSVTAAHACGCTGFPTRFGRDITSSTGIPVTVRTDGIDGATAADALAAARQPALHEALQSADAVVLTIGANDVEPLVTAVPDPARTAATAAWTARVQAGVDDVARSVDALLADLDTSPRHPQVLVTGYWAVGLDGAVGRAVYTPRQAAAQVQLTALVNAALAAVAARHADTYLDLGPVFHGDDGTVDPTPLLALDGDHPSALGHAAIAQALLTRWLPPLHHRRQVRTPPVVGAGGSGAS